MMPGILSDVCEFVTWLLLCESSISPFVPAYLLPPFIRPAETGLVLLTCIWCWGVVLWALSPTFLSISFPSSLPPPLWCSSFPRPLVYLISCFMEHGPYFTILWTSCALTPCLPLLKGLVPIRMQCVINTLCVDFPLSLSLMFRLQPCYLVPFPMWPVLSNI